MNYCLYAQCVLSINTPDKNNKLCLYSVDLCIILVCIDGSKAPKSEEIEEEFEDNKGVIRIRKTISRETLLNIDGKQFHQYQQNEQSPLTELNHSYF